MSSMKEIRTHIKSVEATLKITNAMYLIASSSLRKARTHLAAVKPYFTKMSYTIADILHHSPAMNHPFFDQRTQISKENRKTAYIVITADKGLAGSYNHNVLKLSERELKQQGEPILFLVGQMGKNYFQSRNAKIAHEFLFTAQNPSMTQARAMATPLIARYLSGELDEIWVVYTHMIHPLHLEPTLVKLLPLERDTFPWQPRVEEPFARTVSYYPSEEEVLDHLVPDYFTGMIFGTLVESYCSEQSSRMTAMDAATKNARDLLRNLNLTFNRARQSAITQEITEVVGGARASLE